MTLPRIPTFEELLKKVRQPKVPEPEELDATQASELGFNLPPNWRLRRLEGVDSLISPRGLTFRDLKRDDNGKITDLQVFRGDKPVRLPQPIVEPPVEPPSVEPFEGELPPEGPLRDLFIQRLKAPLPRGPVDIDIALRSERGISLRNLERLTGITQQQLQLGEIPGGLVKPGEYLAPFESPEGFTRVRIRGEATSGLERFGETVIGAVKAPLFEVAGVPISAGDIAAVALIAFGIYQAGSAGWNMLLDRVLRKPGDLNVLGRQLTRAGLNRNLNIWERQRGVKIPPAARKAFIDKYLSEMAASWERVVGGQVQQGTVSIQSLQTASQTAYTQTANVVNREIQALIPRATQTGALAMGGVPEITVQSVVAKIVANQPLTAPERQLYANQSQEVEAALQEQVTPEVTPAITPEVAPTPVVEPVVPAVGEVARIESELRNFFKEDAFRVGMIDHAITTGREIPFVEFDGTISMARVLEQGVRPEEFDNGVRVSIAGRETTIEAEGLIQPIKEQYMARLEQVGLDVTTALKPPIGLGELAPETVQGKIDNFVNVVNKARGQGIEFAPEEIARFPQEVQAVIKPTPPTVEVAQPPVEHRGIEPEGIAIANQLGVQYDGIQAEIGMQFTDPQTGSTTYGNTLEEVRTNLENMRAGFATPPVTPEVPAVPEVTGITLSPSTRFEAELFINRGGVQIGEISTITSEDGKTLIATRISITEKGVLNRTVLREIGNQLENTAREQGFESIGIEARRGEASFWQGVGFQEVLPRVRGIALMTKGIATPPAVEVAKPPVEVVEPKAVPDVAPPAEPIIPPTEPIAKGVVPSTQGMKDLGAKEKVRPARKVLTRIGQWRELFKPTQKAEVELHEEQITKSKMFDKWQKLLGKDKARWALVSDEINKKGSVVGLTANETRVVNEYRKWADEWANRKDLPQTKRIRDYMPHLFEQEATRQIKEEGGIDPVLAQMLSEKVTRKITDPFLKKRLGAVGWVKDPVAAARAYEAVSLKFAYYTPILNKIDTMLADPNIPQSVKNYLSGYSKRMTGELSEIDKSANVTIREFAEKIKNVPVLGNYFYPGMTQGNPMGMASYHLTGTLYGLFLGFKPTSAIRNLSQHTLILGEVGPKHFADGIRLRLTKEGRAAMKNSVVLRSRKFAYTAGLDSSFASRWTDKFRETALYMFRLADKQNVSDAFLAGYSEAKELYPEVSEQVWIDRGDEVAADTQYLYTKMNSMSFSQSAPGRTMSMLTTWTENWMELMTKWIKRTPSQVYLEQERLTGKAPPTKNWSQTYKAIALYMTLVGLAFAFDDQTRFKIKEYTGVGSLRYLAGAVGGEFPAMEAVGSVADITAGFLTDDERMLNSGLAEFKSTFTPGVIRQLSNVGSGEKDWSTLLFYLEGKDFHIKNLKDKWEKGWEKYPVFETPEDKSAYIKTHPKHRGWSDAKIRNQWREDNPLLEAQMFVVSRFTTLSSDKARAEVLRLIEEHKIDTELIDGYEKIFGVDTNAELKTFEDRIGDFEDLVAGEEPKYFTLSNYASEVNKLVKSSGRAKIQKEASPLTKGILEAQDTIEAYDAIKDEDKKIQNEARRLWRRKYPEAEAWMFLLGRFKSFESFEGAEMARDLMEKYDIPIEWLEFPKRTLRRTGRASVTPVSVFSGFGATRPRRAAPTYPTFPKPRISRGLGVRAPTVPGF